MNKETAERFESSRRSDFQMSKRRCLSLTQKLEIILVEFEISLWMCANRANLRSLGAHNDVSAIAAFPNLHFASFENFSSLHIVEECTVALFVAFFDGRYAAELLCEFRKTFLLRSLCKSCVHIRPLIVLPFGCGSEIFRCITNTVQLLKPEFSVLLLVVGSLEEEGSNLLKSLFFRL